MGFGMALNLRSKLDRATTMYVCDTDSTAIEKFRSEVGDRGPIEVVANGCEAVQRAVCHIEACLASADVDARASSFRCFQTGKH